MTIVPNTASLTVGQSVQFSTNVAGAKWSSSNTAIATVTATGLVTAKAAGSVTIRAQAKSQKASAMLTVTAVAPQPAPTPVPEPVPAPTPTPTPEPPPVIDPVLSGDTLIAPSCLDLDIQRVIDAAKNGNTVIVPVGAAFWDHGIVIRNKSIVLRAADTGGPTVITDRTLGSLIVWTVVDVGVPRLTGFTFQGGPDVSSSMKATKGNQGIIQVTGDCSQFVFDHCRVVPTNTAGLVFYGYVRGVVGLNDFLLTNFQVGVEINHNSWGNVGAYGDNSWAQPSTLGTAQALFLEGNTVVVDQPTSPYANAFCDGQNGMRFVARYNTLTDAYISNHGLETSGRLRSARQFEVYNNALTFGSNYNGDAVGMRGGTGVICNNVVTGSGIPADGRGYKVNTIRNTDPRIFFIWGWAGRRTISSITRSGSIATVTVPGGHGLHGAAGSVILHYLTINGATQSEYNGTKAVTAINATQFSFSVSGTPTTPATGTLYQTNPWDGNSDTAGYRAMDQCGAGPGVLISGDYPTPPGSTGLSQTLEPVFGWGNTVNGNAAGISTINPELVVAGRDYVNVVKPGYVPYTYPHPLLG